MASEGILELLSMRESQTFYATQCSRYNDVLEEKERWMLHFDCIQYLIDYEQIEQPDQPNTGEIRFKNLEIGDANINRSMVKYIRTKFGRPQILTMGDVLDLSNGDVIEVKVTYVPSEGTTQYLERAKAKSELEGTELVICDTNSCQILQSKTIFTKNLAVVSQILIARKEVMKKYNLSDDNVSTRIQITELPLFITEQYNKMQISEHWYYDYASATFKGKGLIHYLRMEKEEMSEIKMLSDSLTFARGVYNQLKEQVIFYEKVPVAKYDYKKKQVKIIKTGTKRKIFDDEDEDKEYNTMLSKLRRSPSQRVVMEDLIQQKEKIETLKAKISLSNKRVSVIKHAVKMFNKPINNKEQGLVYRPLIENNFLVEHQPRELREVLFKEKEKPMLKWKSPILPVNQLHYIMDLDITEFFSTSEFSEPFYYSKDGVNDYEGFQVLVEETKKDYQDVLGLKDKNLSKAASTVSGRKVLDLFGVGWKDFTELTEFENLEIDDWERPEEFKTPSNGFPFWISSVVEELSQRNDGLLSIPTLQSNEADTNHKMDLFVERVNSKYFERFTESKIATQISLVENFYNKMGGKLSTGDERTVQEKKSGKRQHKNLRIWTSRLESICYDELVLDEDAAKFKKSQSFGVFWRGPSHAKRPTDKVNIFLLYFLKTIPDLAFFNKMHPNFSLGKVKFNGEDFIYGIRRHAVTRIAPTFYSFISNCIFEPINVIGELLLERLNNQAYSDNSLSTSDFSGYEDVLDSLIAENLIIGMNFSNYDEGFMPFCRYEYLNKIAKSNNEKVFLLDYDKYVLKYKKEFNWSGVSKRYLRHIF